MKTIMKSIVCVAMVLTPLAIGQAAWGQSGLMTHLRCEYRENPLGIDAARKV